MSQMLVFIGKKSLTLVSSSMIATMYVRKISGNNMAAWE